MRDIKKKIWFDTQRSTFCIILKGTPILSLRRNMYHVMSKGADTFEIESQRRIFR